MSGNPDYYPARISFLSRLIILPDEATSSRIQLYSLILWAIQSTNSTHGFRFSSAERAGGESFSCGGSIERKVALVMYQLSTTQGCSHVKILGSRRNGQADFNRRRSSVMGSILYAPVVVGVQKPASIRIAGEELRIPECKSTLMIIRDIWSSDMCELTS